MRKLPEATGPLTPGCMDVMLDYTKEGIFMRLYYPTNPTTKVSENRVPWIPHKNYLYGISKVLLILPLIIQLFYWWLAKAIPVVYGAKIHIAQEKIKCIILSHGLGGHRNLYSNLCCELASRGFLILALEHRDHSASYTYFYGSKKEAENDQRTKIFYKTIELGKHHFKKRQEQVELRSDECCKTIDFLIDLNKGQIPENVINHVENSEIEFSLDDLVGRLDLESMSIIGHSFGGATALLALSKRNELKQGILLDPWMFPIKDGRLFDKLQQPLLFINTQTFHIATNVDAMSEFLAKDTTYMYTLLHTTHENQTDSVLVAGYWLNWFMKKLNPITALRINNSLILRFLNQRVQCPSDISDCEVVLEQEHGNIRPGLTKPWA